MAERLRHGDYLTPPVGPGRNTLMHGGARRTAPGLPIDAVRTQGRVLDRLPA